MTKPPFRPVLLVLSTAGLILPWACTRPLPTVPGNLPTQTLTPTGTSTSTVIPIPTGTATPTVTLAGTDTPTPLDTPTITDTPTVLHTATDSPTPTFTRTQTGTMTETRTPTNTRTITDTPTVTQTRTVTGTPTSIATAMAGAPDLNLSGGVTTLNAGIHYFNCVNLGPGAVVTINGGVTIFAKCFILASGATITGVGKGYKTTDYYAQPPQPGRGQGGSLVTYPVVPPGGPPIYSQSGGGGGHGGRGGTANYYGVTVNGCWDQVGGVTVCQSLGAGGPANDNPFLPTYMGSAGYSNTGYSSAGGALLKLVVIDPLVNLLSSAILNGTIDMSGMGGVWISELHDGGGAGGTLLLEAGTLTGNGVLLSDGGDGGGTDANGGGGGGIISLIADTTGFSGTTSVKAGHGGFGAQPGIVTVTAPPASGYW